MCEYATEGTDAPNSAHSAIQVAEKHTCGQESSRGLEVEAEAKTTAKNFKRTATAKTTANEAQGTEDVTKFASPKDEVGGTKFFTHDDVRRRMHIQLIRIAGICHLAGNRYRKAQVSQ